jgi:hypothetical protein
VQRQIFVFDWIRYCCPICTTNLWPIDDLYCIIFTLELCEKKYDNNTITSSMRIHHNISFGGIKTQYIVHLTTSYRMKFYTMYINWNYNWNLHTLSLLFIYIKICETWCCIWTMIVGALLVNICSVNIVCIFKIKNAMEQLMTNHYKVSQEILLKYSSTTF